MTSYEVIHSSDSFPSGEFSLLGDAGGGEPTQNGLMNGFNLTNLQSSLSCSSPDTSVDVIHSKIANICTANQTLKSLLSQSQLLMKDKMETICSWRTGMIHALEEAKTKISELELANEELSKNLDLMTKQLEELTEQKLSLEQKACEKCETLEPAMVKVKEELDSTETVKNILIGQLTEKNCSEEMIRQNLSTVLDFLTNLTQSRRIPKQDKHQLYSVIQALNDQVISLGGDCRTNESTDEAGYVVIDKSNQETALEVSFQLAQENESIKKSLDEKDELIDCLKKQELELSEKLKAYEKRLQQYEQDQKKNFDILSSQLDSERQLNDKYKERCDTLQVQLEEQELKLQQVHMSDDHVLNNLREEKKNLEEILKLEQSSNQKDKERLNELRVQCEKFQVDYDRVTQLLEIQSKDAKKKEEELNASREASVKELKLRAHSQMLELNSKVDHLTAHMVQTRDQIEELKAEIKQKNDDITRLTEEKENMDTQLHGELKQKDEDIVKLTEEIEMLKTQVQYYRIDVEEAVATRDTAHAEIVKLEKEIKALKSGGSRRSSTSSRRSNSGHNQEATGTDFGPFTCPICGNSFTDLHVAEAHVEQSHPIGL